MLPGEGSDGGISDVAVGEIEVEQTRAPSGYYVHDIILNEMEEVFMWEVLM